MVSIKVRIFCMFFVFFLMWWKVAEFATPQCATSKDYFEEKAIEKQMQEKLSTLPVFA